MLTRILSALVLIPVVVGILWFAPPTGTNALLAIVLAVALGELAAIAPRWPARLSLGALWIAAPLGIGEPIRWTPTLILVLAYNWVITTALGYFLWNKVLSVMSAGVAGQVMALTPVGGFLLSVAIFGGEITADVVVSIGLIVGGIILTLRAR